MVSLRNKDTDVEDDDGLDDEDDNDGGGNCRRKTRVQGRTDGIPGYMGSDMVSGQTRTVWLTSYGQTGRYGCLDSEVHTCDGGRYRGDKYVYEVTK